MFRSKIVLSFFVLIAVHFASVSESSAAREVQNPPLYVLVPGFFNTAIPGHFADNGSYTPYFANAVVKTVQRYGEVIVVDNLIPVGTVETNGVRLEKFLTKTSQQYPGRPMILITHSAGGLYSARALTLRPSLPVQTVVTIATPYMGIDFIDYLGANVPGLAQLAHYLYLDSLREFRKQDMTALLNSFAVPQHIRWVSIAGHQPACRLLGCAKAANLSWLLTLAQSLTGDVPTDGIVTVQSALGYGAQVRGALGLPIQIERWEDMEIPLEHWEIVQEARLFKLLGVLDTILIEKLQREYFSRIIERLGGVPTQQVPAL